MENKMVSAFANCTTFIFETDPAFHFETNDKVQTDGMEDTTQSQCE